jgi:probable dihydroxyacetone kinase regulator
MSGSQITEKALSDALISLCKQKRFAKISIADITDLCGLNRQTFYYHFVDKYQLLDWTYRETALTNFYQGISLENWNDHVLTMLEAIQHNRDFYRNTVQSDPGCLASCFAKICQQLFFKLFARLDQDNDVDKENRSFYARFFSYGCSGILIHWIQHNFREKAAKIAGHLRQMATDTERLSSAIYRDNPPDSDKTGRMSENRTNE